MATASSIPITPIVTQISTKKIDIKTWIIIFLIGICLIFCFKWFFSPDKYAAENKKLTSNIASIQKERDSLKIKNDSLQKSYLSLQYDLSNYLEKDSVAKSISIKLQLKLDSTMNNLNELNNKVNITKKQIDNLQLNPIKRSGDSLINSLKKKFN